MFSMDAQTKQKKSVEKKLAEVVLMNYIDNHQYTNDLYIPTYFKEELQIADCSALIKKLEKKRLIYKQEETKIISLTEQGKKTLIENADYVEFFKAAIPCVSIWDYEKQRKKMKQNSDFTAVMITLLLQKIPALKKKDDFVGVKNLHYDIGYLYEEGGYSPQAMYHYLTSLYYEICGLEYYDDFIKYIENEQSAKALEELYSYTYINPQLMSGIERMKDTFYDDMVDAIYKNNPISINICNKDKFKELSRAIIEGKYVNKDWQIFFWTNYKKLIAVAKKFRL